MSSVLVKEAVKHIRHNRFEGFKKQLDLQSMILPGLLATVIFMYLPMFGLMIAFQNYTISGGFFHSPWVGFKYFQEFLTDTSFLLAVRNTLAINLIGLALSFPIPILFAILLNEIKILPLKHLTQTISYLPHFISWILFGGIIVTFLSMDNGVVNHLLIKLHIVDEPVPFMYGPHYFWWIVIASQLIKETGWGSIIYLAAISGIDPVLYEAAVIDGASRFSKIRHVTLPSISGVITVFLIFSISSILSTGFDMVWILQNNAILDTAEVIDTYVYKVGISQMRLSYSAAVGLARSVIALILLVCANSMAKRINDKGIF